MTATLSSRNHAGAALHPADINVISDEIFADT